MEAKELAVPTTIEEALNIFSLFGLANNPQQLHIPAPSIELLAINCEHAVSLGVPQEVVDAARALVLPDLVEYLKQFGPHTPTERPEERKPVVPTRGEVIAAGYDEAAADRIIADQQELLDAWNAAHPAPDPVKVHIKSAVLRVHFVCPRCVADHSLETTGLLSTVVTCQCGCVMELVNAEGQ